ncbi:MAG: hypothetical protein HY719_00575 [Planctomycetes bacterium]|nr:hypothetical protein [Planctomycetota bacterium]
MSASLTRSTLERRLRRIRASLFGYALVAAALVGVGVASIATLAAVQVDARRHLTVEQRRHLLPAAAVAGMVGAACAAARWLRRVPRGVALAARIERARPGFKNALIAAMESAAAPAAVVERALPPLRNVSGARVLRGRRVALLLTLAGLPVLLLAAAFFCTGAVGEVLWSRLWLTDPAARGDRAFISLAPGDLELLPGERAEVDIALAGPMLETPVVETRHADGSVGRHAAREIAATRFIWNAKWERDGDAPRSYRVTVGELATPWHTVRLTAGAEVRALLVVAGGREHRIAPDALEVTLAVPAGQPVEVRCEGRFAPDAAGWLVFADRPRRPMDRNPSGEAFRAVPPLEVAGAEALRVVVATGRRTLYEGPTVWLRAASPSRRMVTLYDQRAGAPLPPVIRLRPGETLAADARLLPDQPGARVTAALAPADAGGAPGAGAAITFAPAAPGERTLAIRPPSPERGEWRPFTLRASALFPDGGEAHGETHLLLVEAEPRAVASSPTSSPAARQETGAVDRRPGPRETRTGKEAGDEAARGDDASASTTPPRREEIKRGGADAQAAFDTGAASAEGRAARGDRVGGEQPARGSASSTGHSDGASGAAVGASGEAGAAPSPAAPRDNGAPGVAGGEGGTSGAGSTGAQGSAAGGTTAGASSTGADDAGGSSDGGSPAGPGVGASGGRDDTSAGASGAAGGANGGGSSAAGSAGGAGVAGGETAAGAGPAGRSSSHGNTAGGAGGSEPGAGSVGAETKTKSETGGTREERGDLVSGADQPTGNRAKADAGGAAAGPPPASASASASGAGSDSGSGLGGGRGGKGETRDFQGAPDARGEAVGHEVHVPEGALRNVDDAPGGSRAGASREDLAALGLATSDLRPEADSRNVGGPGPASSASGATTAGKTGGPGTPATTPGQAGSVADVAAAVAAARGGSPTASSSAGGGVVAPAAGRPVPERYRSLVERFIRALARGTRDGGARDAGPDGEMGRWGDKETPRKAQAFRQPPR